MESILARWTTVTTGNMDAFASVLQSARPWPAVAIASFLSGIAMHLAIRPFEIDTHTLEVVSIYIVTLIAGFLALLLHSGLDVAGSLTTTFLVTSAFNTGLFTSLLVYRAFFHRLHRFPGPFLSKLTRFRALKVALQTKQTHLAIEKIHDQYGDFVRVGPRELAVFRPAAIGAIYGPSSKCGRSLSYANPSQDPSKTSLLATRDPVMHRRRKRAWERGLGFRALDVYEPRVASKVDLFLSRLALYEGVPVDVTRLCGFLGFDIMGDVGFSKDFQLLQSDREHPAVSGVREQVVYIGVLGTVPWLLVAMANVVNMLSRLGLTFSFQAFLDWCGRELQARRQILEVEKKKTDQKDPQDVISWLIRAEDEGDGSAPPGERAFQEDARVLVVAGSDTTSAALTNALYYLARYPAVYRKLQASLDAEFPGGEADWTYAKAKGVKYLDDVIHETLRLKPSVPSGLPRVTPPEGLRIDEVFIPGGVNVSVHPHTIHRDPRYWDRPREFVPERWDGLTPEKAPFIAFTRGLGACPGKNLAMMEMRMVLGRIALRYQRMGFADPDDVERFDERALDTFTMALPPLPLVLTRR